MANRIPESEWVWYGFAGHFIGGKDCAYHLCTRIGGYLISTVGMYYPGLSRGASPTPIGAGKDAILETYVFRCDGEDSDGNPITGLNEIDSERYADSMEAERGHCRYCEKYATQGEPTDA